MKPRLIIPIALVVLVVVVIALDAQRRQAKAELQQMSVKLDQLQGGNTAENQQRAKEVVEMVKTHMTLDTSVEPTVATIVDVEKLKAQNPFYNSAKNGDFLIVTPSRAILYDAGADVILDVVPVQIDQTPPSSAAAQ
ncbi:hypothetical protein K8942_01270 [Candidatus Peribacteria bacterium]|nr:MAG: hypothetical protein K8942_01270 [Candidatus Peribacteria bacterium]